ncbi:DNA-directed DNA polymerase family B exonuclease domain, partial [Trinorchestia longiramus]
MIFKVRLGHIKPTVQRGLRIVVCESSKGVTVESPDCVRVSKSNDGAPPVVVLTLSLRTVLNSNTRQSEVVGVACLLHPQFPLDKPPPAPPYTEHFCVLTKPSDTVWPWDMKTRLLQYSHTKLHKTDTERALLGYLLSRIQQLDPDVVVGHDLLGYDVAVLLHRLQANKVPHWSRLGRLRRTVMPKINSRGGYGERTALCGRLACDVLLSAKELIRARSYDLPTLTTHVLNLPSPDPLPDHTAVRKMFETSDSLLRLVSVSMQSCLLVLRLLCELSVLPLALQITNIAGNVMSRTLLGGRSERNEFLLLHAFTEKDFIPPDKLPRGK